MKRRTRIGSVVTIAVLSAILVGSGAAFGRAHCQRVYGDGLTFQDTPFGPFVGTAELNLGDAEAVVALLGPPDEKPDGTLHVVTSHAFDLGDSGGLVTIDKAILAPTETPGLYNLNTRAKICATPDCAGETVNGPAPCGRLSVHGTINFGTFPAEADWRVNGKVCDCGADED